MSTFTPHTGAGKWIGYQVIVGAGRGLGGQQPFLAVQAYCTPEQLPVGTAVVAWSMFFGGALLVTFGQTAFANLLRGALTQYVPDVDQESIVGAGATNYAVDVPAAQQTGVLLAYNKAVTQTYYLGVAATAAAVFTAMAMGRAKTKGKAKKGDAMQEAEKGEVETKV